MNGYINVLKPVGLSSSETVIKVRRLLRQFDKEAAVGHMGTLDPLASGVLPVGIGKANRLFERFLQKQKSYIAIFTFGKETDSLDSCGKITASDEKTVSLKDLEEVLPMFIGEISQIPPQFSAISVDGARAYNIARSGGEVQLKARQVKVTSIKVLEKMTDNRFLLRIDCGAGVYVRSLVRDIAHALGTVGYMSALIRIKSGVFCIENSFSLEELEKDVMHSITPTIDALSDMTRYEPEGSEKTKLFNGLSVKTELVDGEYLVTEDGNAAALSIVADGLQKLTVRLQ